MAEGRPARKAVYYELGILFSSPHRQQDINATLKKIKTNQQVPECMTGQANFYNIYHVNLLPWMFTLHLGILTAQEPHCQRGILHYRKMLTIVPEWTHSER